MNDLEEFAESLSEATRQLFSDIEEAWNELKEDLKEVVTVKYLRPGGVACCRAEGKKYYGILTGTQIISLNAEKEPEYMDLEEFLALHGAEKLKVAGKNRIAVGSHETDHAARMAVEEERFPSTRTFVLKCLGVTEASSVDEALAKKFGAFDWLAYDLPEETEESRNEEENASE